LLFRFERALDDAEACVQACPKWWKAYFRLGEVYRFLGEYLHAASAYQRALDCAKVDPPSTQAQQEGALQDLRERHLAVIQLAQLSLQPAETLHPVEASIGLTASTVWVVRGAVVMMLVMAWLVFVDSCTSKPAVKGSVQVAATMLGGMVLGGVSGWVVGVWRSSLREIKLRPPSVTQEQEPNISKRNLDSKITSEGGRRGSRSRRRALAGKHKDQKEQTS